MAKYKEKDFRSEWYRINAKELAIVCEALDLLLESETLNDLETYVADELKADLINSNYDHIALENIFKEHGSV
mgnify:CR=1 FL=1|jgi:hypothetical protein